MTTRITKKDADRIRKGGKDMGHRTTQRILECAICGRTPDDGEHMWEMCGEYHCKDCVDKDHEDDEAPEIFPGTNDALDDLGA